MTLTLELRVGRWAVGNRRVQRPTSGWTLECPGTRGYAIHYLRGQPVDELWNARGLGVTQFTTYGCRHRAEL